MIRLPASVRSMRLSAARIAFSDDTSDSGMLWTSSRTNVIASTAIITRRPT